MTTFIIRRVFWTIPVILLVILMTFLLMKQIGGNPFRKTERNVPEAIQRNLDSVKSFEAQMLLTSAATDAAAKQMTSLANTWAKFVSTVTGAEAAGTDLDPEYWWRNVREPVRFADAAAQTEQSMRHWNRWRSREAPGATAPTPTTRRFASSPVASAGSAGACSRSSNPTSRR